MVEFATIFFVAALVAVASSIRICRSQSNRLSRQAVEIERLVEENRMLKLSEAFADVGHWRVDFLTDRLFWSDQTFKIHGLPVGATPTLEAAIDAFHPNDRETVAQAVDAARTTGKPYRFTARLYRPDGSLRHTESVAQVELDKSGVPRAIFGTFADRTEDEKARRELQEAKQAAELAGEAKSVFLAKMSHEIRTPMNAIVGFADLLSMEGLEGDQKQKVDIIASSARSLTALLNDILDLSKVEAGQIKIADAPMDIRSVIDEVIQLFEQKAKQKGIVINSSVSASIPALIQGDELRIRQILVNLVGNGLKFTDSGTIDIDAFSHDRHIFIDVTDTGVGMDPAFLSDCFEPFTQSQTFATSANGGTGMGLAICQQLVRLMDGDITVRSELGNGASFLVKLPLVAAPERRIANAVDAAVSFCRGARVLLAEDFDINQMLIAEMAKKLSLDVEIASNGREAANAVIEAHSRGEPFHLVLMDLQMPELNGFEACRLLRETGFGAEDLPIIALSANAFPDDIAACIDAGMQDHIAKPVEFGVFAQKLSEYLATSATRDGSRLGSRAA